MKVVIDDCRLEKMDVYTDPLNDKIKRQAEEITRLLAENAELKKGREAIRDNAFEAGLIRGQEEAWKLAHKMSSMGFDEAAECFPDYDFPLGMRSLTKKYSYSEAAAKVAEWERKKEEICVGDVVTFHGNCGLVTFIGQNIKGISKSGLAFITCKEECTKTGKHIDVDAWLAQIGGDCNE